MPPEPPANGGYMTAAYIVAAYINRGYSSLLGRGRRRAIGG